LSKPRKLVEEEEELADYELDDAGDYDRDSVCGVGYIRGGNDDAGQLPLNSQPSPAFEGPEPVQTPEPVSPDPGAEPVDEHSRYQPHTGYGMGLYAADNAFQRLKRYLMLWNVAHLWKKASMLILINYRHHNIVYVYRAPVEAPIIIHSKEGISQGCGMAMQAYGIELLPLCQRMNEQLPGVTKPWYSDDALSIRTASDNVQCLAFLVQYGRMYGYFTQPATSWYVCKAEDEAIAREEFTNLGLTIRFSPGQQYLGGFFGCKECKDAWLTDSCNK